MRDEGDDPLPEALAQFEAVSVVAGDVKLLDAVSLVVARGAPTAVLGPNGAGKTTLLRVLMGLLQPSGGKLTIRAGTRALVFQAPVMLRRSAAGNVALALAAAGYPADGRAVDALLDRVGLSPMAHRPARKLSGGERQRLAIARALARQPDLLLLDEATASLDPAQTRIIEGLIGDIARSGVKVVFATHDLGQARRLAGDVVLLVQGRVAERATATDFFDQPASEAARRFLAGDLVFSAGAQT